MGCNAGHNEGVSRHVLKNRRTPRVLALLADQSPGKREAPDAIPKPNHRVLHGARDLSPSHKISGVLCADTAIVSGPLPR